MPKSKYLTDYHCNQCNNLIGTNSFKYGSGLCQSCGNRKSHIGMKHSKETKLKMSEIMKKVWKNEEYYKYMVDKHKGHIVSEETKEKDCKVKVI